MAATGLADWQLGICRIVALASSPVGQGNAFLPTPDILQDDAMSHGGNNLPG